MSGVAEQEVGPLSAAELMDFGPVVEAEVLVAQWLPLAEGEQPDPWLLEEAARTGKPKLGQVFNSEGVARAVIIRPCMSRGARLRGMRAIYTPQMLEADATVYAGWPGYLDHKVQEAAKRGGRSVKELGGQILRTWWDGDFVHEDDEQYGYQKGAVLGEVWANEYVRKLVGNNPGMLHMSISAWPKSAKPGPAPWAPNGERGMIIEGIRRMPQGSVDFVPRGGAGGRLLPLKEGEESGVREFSDPGWSAEDEALAVSVAESVYSPGMSARDTTQGGGSGGNAVVDLRTLSPEAARAWLAENAPGVIPPVQEAQSAPLTAEQVSEMLDQKLSGLLTEEEVEERVELRLAERETVRALATEATRLIDSAEGIPPRMRESLRVRYAIDPEQGPSPVLESITGSEEKSAMDELREAVRADLEEVAEMVAEAQGKPRPRVVGEGGAASDPLGSTPVTEAADDEWATLAEEHGVVDNVEEALSVFGGKATTTTTTEN